MRRLLPFLPLLSPLGCDPAADERDERDPAAEEGGEPTLPSAYEYTPPEEAEATIDLAAVEAAVNELLAGARALHAGPAIEGYLAAMAESDGYCPAYYEQDGNTFWYAACQADSGAEYSGYAFYNLYQGEDLFGDGNLWDADAIAGAADITAADGARFHLGGNAYLARSLGDGETTPDLYASIVNGAFLAENPDLDGTWITSGGSPSLTLYALDYSDVFGFPGLNALYVDGVTPLSGSLTAASFSGVGIYSEYLGYPCAEEPMGSLSVRDAAGNWFEITFDVNEDLSIAEGGECDGCAMVTHQAEVLGEVCIDASPLLDWSDTPWEGL